MAKAMYVGVPSRLPDGYTLLECIKNTTTEKIGIDTEFSGNRNTKIIVEFKLLSGNYSSGTIIGGSNTTNLSCIGLGYSKTNNRINVYHKLAMDANGYINFQSKYIYINLNDNKKHIIEYTNDKVILDGITKLSDNNLMSDIETTTLKLFTGCTYESQLMELYSCKIYDSNILVRDFIPCVSPDGEVGMYDLVNNKFHGNHLKTTNPLEFTSGSVVDDTIKKVDSIYVGVSNKARKVKKAYIGDENGKARLFYEA